MRGLEIAGREAPVGFVEAQRIAKISERVMAAAMASKPDVVLPKHVKPDVQIGHQTQASRAAEAGVGRQTQIKLDALARQAPALLDEVKAGRMSAHGAAKAAGIVKTKTPFDELCRWWIGGSALAHARARFGPAETAGSGS